MAVFDRDYFPIIASLARGAIAASIKDLESYDRLTIALREALRYGANVDELSEATGLTPFEIRRRTKADLFVLSELETLAS